MMNALIRGSAFKPFCHFRLIFTPSYTGTDIFVKKRDNFHVNMPMEYKVAARERVRRVVASGKISEEDPIFSQDLEHFMYASTQEVKSENL